MCVSYPGSLPFAQLVAQALLRGKSTGPWMFPQQMLLRARYIRAKTA